MINRKNLLIISLLSLALSAPISAYNISYSQAGKLAASTVLIAAALRLLSKKQVMEEPELAKDANLFQKIWFYIDNKIIGQKESVPFEHKTVYKKEDENDVGYHHYTKFPFRGIGGFIHKYWKNVAAAIGIYTAVNKVCDDAVKYF